MARWRWEKPKKVMTEKACKRGAKNGRRRGRMSECKSQKTDQEGRKEKKRTGGRCASWVKESDPTSTSRRAQMDDPRDVVRRRGMARGRAAQQQPVVGWKQRGASPRD